MKKPSLSRMPAGNDLEQITATKNGQKVVGHASANGAHIYFLENGSEIIEDDAGNVLTDWPEYVPPAPEEEGQADE